MGRRKITIKQIPDVKLRHITFNKRKNGLFKKAAELSVLCNLNLLLICEDGLGNIIQFSKNKITNVNNFLSQCTYQNVIDLTSEDYPDFAKINKKKDKDKDEDESSPEEEPTKEKSTRTYAQMINQSRDQPKGRRKSPSNSPVDDEQYQVTQRQKPRNLSMAIPENLSSQAGNGPDSVTKKNKNKLNLRLKIPKAEGAPESQNHIMNETDVKMQANNVEQNYIPSERPRKQSDYQPTRVPEKNNVDFTSPPFMPMVDPMRRLGSYYESMASPFKFYGQNPRMEPLSTMLKGLSPFTFPITGTPLVPKQNLGDGEDKIFDAAAALRYMNRAGMAPETGGNSVGSHKVFTFQPEEGNLINNRNELALMNQRQQMQNQVQMQNQMHEYMNLPSAMKSELDFDINMPPETLSARRFNFDGYFKDFDENGFGDLRKKYKLT